MKLVKTSAGRFEQLPEAPGQCLLVEGALRAHASLEMLPQTALPAVILAWACDAHLERLLNQRGCAVTCALDPVEALPEGSEVDLDLLAGVLCDKASGREYALKPLPRRHLEFIHSHA